MHITVVTVACFAAALIAGTTPVRAQTLPVYDVDAETARCVTEAETGKEWTGALKNWCQAIGKDEHLAHDQLAERWDSYDMGKRMSCVADKRIAEKRFHSAIVVWHRAPKKDDLVWLMVSPNSNVDSTN
jgi:hypothetical protein